MGWRWERQRVTIFTATYMEPGLLSSLPDKNTKILSTMPETHFSVPLGAEMGSFRGPVGLESSKPICYWVIHLHESFLLLICLKTTSGNSVHRFANWFWASECDWYVHYLVTWKIKGFLSLYFCMSVSWTICVISHTACVHHLIKDRGNHFCPS